jgi:hypothetical protein
MVCGDLDEDAVVGFFLGFINFIGFLFISSGGRPFAVRGRILLGIGAFLRFFIISYIL